ncbi:MAG TPA: adenylate/guanylate cyclase domain-containing protein, partial [Spirochaetales bacterium]|nr:adenylate/guanylate cyclase domain-containing protein [Spirochaetales bacterium]
LYRLPPELAVSAYASIALFFIILAAYRKRLFSYAPSIAYFAVVAVKELYAARGAQAGMLVAFGAVALLMPSAQLLRSWDKTLRLRWRILVLCVPLVSAFLYLQKSPAYWLAAAVLLLLFALASSSVSFVKTRLRRMHTAIILPGYLLCAALPFIAMAIPLLFSTIPSTLAYAVLGLGMALSSMTELAAKAPQVPILDQGLSRMSASIGRFIPAEFLEELRKDSVEDLKLGDHIKKEMTIFFSDIRSFTTMSERLTPEESFAFINSYLSRVVPVVNAHNGFVDKYMGDAIMALYAKESGADDAVASAIEMQKKMVEYNGHRAKVNYKPVAMGIGIHTGTLMLGVVGVAGRMEGTVISDSVNLASRLQSIAKAFNIPLVISESTFMALKDPGKFKYRFIGKVRVKGKSAPVSAFEIFDGLPQDEFERKMKGNTFFEQGILAYYRKEFTDGIFYFNQALEVVPDDGASKFYLETCLRKSMLEHKA